MYQRKNTKLKTDKSKNNKISTKLKVEEGKGKSVLEDMKVESETPVETIDFSYLG